MAWIWQHDKRTDNIELFKKIDEKKIRKRGWENPKLKNSVFAFNL